jgi:hypothetical protein
MANVANSTRSESAAPVEPFATGVDVVPYEQQLNQDGGWALSEGSLHFQGKSEVQKALSRLCKRLNELKIPYAVAGAMALFQHGYRRFTEDVDILVTREGLDAIHAALEGLGYVRLFSNSKNLRDTEDGVRIDFLVTGQFPGDGKHKPVAFPNPADAAVELNGMRVLDLPKLLELKLASGMTGAGRRKDVGDVQETIKFLKLPKEFAEQLDPYVRALYLELWTEAEQGKAFEQEY